MTSADAQRDRARRPAAGIPIDAGYLEHLRNMRRLSRAQVAELVGVELFDRKHFSKVLDGTEPLDARTLRVLARVLGERPPGSAEAPGGGWLLDSAALDALLERRGWTREDLAGKVARAGRSRDSIAKIENGERNPTPGTLGALCAVLSAPDHVVEPGELITGGSPRSAAREAAAKRARESYYEGLRAFAIDRGDVDGNGEVTVTAELRQAYDGFLLAGSVPDTARAAS
jgi:transcriptional regulator with XRE-family HTH domain